MVSDAQRLGGGVTGFRRISFVGKIADSGFLSASEHTHTLLEHPAGKTFI